METDLAGLFDQLLHAVGNQGRFRRHVTLDVVERTVAEGTFPPITAMGERQLVPASVAPELVHRIGNLHDREVTLQRQSAVIRSAGLLRLAFGQLRLVIPTDATLLQAGGPLQEPFVSFPLQIANQLA